MNFYLGLLSPIIIYSSFMIYKTPTIADSIICFVLAFIPVSFYFIDNRHPKSQEDTGLVDLRRELEKEQLAARLDDVKHYAQKQKIRQDAEGSPTSNNRNFIF